MTNEERKSKLERHEMAVSFSVARNLARTQVHTLIEMYANFAVLYGEREGFFSSIFSFGKKTKNYWLNIKIHGIIVLAKDKYYANVHTAIPFDHDVYFRAYDYYLRMALKSDRVNYLKSFRESAPSDKYLDYAIAYIDRFYSGRNQDLSECSFFKYKVPSYKKREAIKEKLLERWWK